MTLNGNNKPFVVLLQGDSSNNDNKYTKLLEEGCINAKSIPILTFNFINEDKLSDKLSEIECYDGIIFSSPRAVSAVSAAISPHAQRHCIENWNNKYIFSVGKATADLAKSLLNLESHGSSAGNGEKLCQYIIDKRREITKPLIFPCSSIRRDTIPLLLFQNGIQIEEVTCYETAPNPEFENIWKKLISVYGCPEIVIFFSPSGVEASIGIIRETCPELPICIAIGPSTEKILLDSNIMCKTAERPTPESVLSVVNDVLQTLLKSR